MIKFCKEYILLEKKFYLKIFDNQYDLDIVKSLNLYFRIEKSRVVIPTLLEAAKRKDDTQKLSWQKVYDLLFTRKNLKLVQKACHDKAARENTLEWRTFLIDYPS